MGDVPDHDHVDGSKVVTPPSGEPPLSGLMAIALVRRLLLERTGSESPDGRSVMGEPLEDWVVRPLQDFGGLSPAQIVGRAGGQDMLRAWLDAKNV